MERYENLEKLLTPYWRGNTVFRESLLFCGREDGYIPPQPLLYPATSITELRSATLEIEYREGEDYRLRDGCVEYIAGTSRMPLLPYAELYPEDPEPGRSFPRTGGGNLCFSEGSFFHDRQVVVSYTHASTWHDYTPATKAALLPRTRRTLLDTERIPRVLFMGDSITEGANSSGPVGMPPHIGAWWQLVAAGLERKYGKPVEDSRIARGGETAAWGAVHAAEGVALQPDLVVIAFGMNDGSGKRSVADFKRDIVRIMETFPAGETEFVLVASILPNPEARDFVGPHLGMREALLELETEHVAVADVTSMHQAFLRRKPYASMTGNNINHLNDCTARMQAQVVLQTLGAYD